MPSRAGIALLVCAVASLGDVHGHAGTPVSRADSCNPKEAILGEAATLVGAHGRYRLVLVAHTGDRRVSGVLVLVASPPEREVLGSASTPLQGSTDIDLGAVGAHRIGDPTSTDPDAPGVLVIESERGGTRQILLRLGSDANRVDQRLYEGGHTVLRVQQIHADGFSGVWESAVRSSVTGYFCATRL